MTAALNNYTATYGSNETSEVAIDLLVGILASVFSFVSLIALILIFGWMRKHVPLKL